MVAASSPLSLPHFISTTLLLSAVYFCIFLPRQFANPPPKYITSHGNAPPVVRRHLLAIFRVFRRRRHERGASVFIVVGVVVAVTLPRGGGGPHPTPPILLTTAIGNVITVTIPHLWQWHHRVVIVDVVVGKIVGTLVDDDVWIVERVVIFTRDDYSEVVSNFAVWPHRHGKTIEEMSSPLVPADVVLPPGRCIDISRRQPRRNDDGGKAGGVCVVGRGRNRTTTTTATDDAIVATRRRFFCCCCVLGDCS